jgi:anti-sigma regulatory factor (Ser/Thr protein kinase)
VALKLEAAQVGSAELAVVFYERERQLASRVAEWLLTAADGAVTVVIATPEHQATFKQAAAAAGFDWSARVRDGALVCLDARATLDQLCEDGHVDAAGFRRVVGRVIAKLAATGRPVRAYGEMVALLWRAGHVVAAVELEQAWDELLRELPLELMCSYPSELAQSLEQGEAPDAVSDLHAAVLAPVADPATLAVSVDFQRELTAPGDARRFVRGTLSRWGRPHDLIEDAELAVSEFATNAFLHAGSPFTVELQGRIDGVRIEVSDSARGVHPRICTNAHPLDSSGRGLRLVAEVAVDWGFELTSRGKTVWAELSDCGCSPCGRAD